MANAIPRRPFAERRTTNTPPGRAWLWSTRKVTWPTRFTTSWVKAEGAARARNEERRTARRVIREEMMSSRERRFNPPGQNRSRGGERAKKKRLGRRLPRAQVHEHAILRHAPDH